MVGTLLKGLASNPHIARMVCIVQIKLRKNPHHESSNTTSAPRNPPNCRHDFCISGLLCASQFDAHADDKLRSIRTEFKRHIVPISCRQQTLLNIQVGTKDEQQAALLISLLLPLWVPVTHIQQLVPTHTHSRARLGAHTRGGRTRLKVLGASLAASIIPPSSQS